MSDWLQFDHKVAIPGPVDAHEHFGWQLFHHPIIISIEVGVVTSNSYIGIKSKKAPILRSFKF